MKDLIPEWAKDRSELMRRDMEQYFNNMQREMDRLFSPLMGRMQSGLGEAETFMRKFMPAVNVSEDEKQIS